MLPDYQRARRIGDFHVDPRTKMFNELLMDLVDRNARAVVLGMLPEEELRGG